MATYVMLGSPASQRVAAMVAAPRFYDGPYRYYGGLYPAGYVGRSAMAHQGWEAIARRAIARFDPMSGTYRPRWPTALLPVVRHYYLGEFQQR